MGAAFEVPGADIRGHNHDRVLEIHGVAEAVGKLAVFENLEQNVENVGVRLLNLVEQDDRVRRPADAFRELTALLVADVTGR